MANLKVVIGCSVSAFFGLLWYFVWKKPPRQKPAVTASPEKKHEVNSNTKNATTSREKSKMEEKETERVEKLIQIEKSPLQKSSSSTPLIDDEREQSTVEEVTVRLKEGVVEPEIISVTDVSPQKSQPLFSHNDMSGNAVADMSTSDFNTEKLAGINVSVVEKNSALNEAFVTSSGDSSFLDKSKHSYNDNGAVEETLSTSTIEPLLESTKLDMTFSDTCASKGDQSTMSISRSTHSKHDSSIEPSVDKNNESVHLDTSSSNGDKMSWSEEVCELDSVEESHLHPAGEREVQSPSGRKSHVTSDSNSSNCDTVSIRTQR